MNPQNPARAYLQRQLEQATPLQSTLLLLDGMLKFTLQAKEAIDRKDIEGRYSANRRAMDITTFMVNQPDPATGEAAARLSVILMSLLQKQVQIDFTNTVEACDEVAGLIRQLRAGFSSLQPNRVVAGPETAPSKPLAATA